MSKKGRSRVAPRKGGLNKAQVQAAKQRDRKKIAQTAGAVALGMAGGNKKKHRFKRKQQATAAAQGMDTSGLPHGYDECTKTLLVGEGNFSFARALVRLYNGNGFSLVATAYDSEDVVHKKYEDATRILEEVRASGATVHFGVDAGDLVSSLKLAKKRRKNGGMLDRDDQFDRIVFNFPHVGLGIKDQDVNLRKNQELLQKFFASATELVRVGGEIHMALKKGMPYSQWNTVGNAHRCSGGKLVQRTEHVFDCAAFPGYAHRRTLGFKEGMSKGENEEVVGQSRTYVFERTP